MLDASTLFLQAVGIGPRDMSFSAWFLMGAMTVLWLVVAVAAGVSAVRATSEREPKQKA